MFKNIHLTKSDKNNIKFLFLLLLIFLSIYLIYLIFHQDPGEILRETTDIGRMSGI